MRIILQRVSRASVSVGGQSIAAIGPGALLLVGVTAADTAADAEWLAAKVATLRIFPALDGPSGFDRSLLDTGGEALVVSQFTLYGEARKGRRPDFMQAARPEAAQPLIEAFAAALRAQGVRVQQGAFGAAMQVSLVNDGPVTLILERP